MIKPEISEVTEFVFGIRYGNIELRRPSSITSSDRRLRKPTPTPHVLYKISNQSNMSSHLGNSSNSIFGGVAMKCYNFF